MDEDIPTPVEAMLELQALSEVETQYPDPYAEPLPVKQVAEPPAAEPVRAVLIESDGEPREYAVSAPVHPRAHTLTLDGDVYHHVSDHVDGRWIYRKHDA